MSDPHYGEDGTRCVIVKPGDVLILAGPTGDPDEGVADAFQAVKEALGLRHVIVCDRLDDVQVRNLDVELADAVQAKEDAFKLMEVGTKLNHDLIDERDRLLTELAQSRNAARRQDTR